MKKISELATVESLKQITNGSTAETPSNHDRPSLDDKTLARLFVVLDAHYPRRFSSQFPTDESERAAKRIWGEALAGLDLEEIKTGLETMRQHYRSYPPTIGEFLELCRPPGRLKKYKEAQLEDKTGQSVTWAERVEAASPHLKALSELLRK